MTDEPHHHRHPVGDAFEVEAEALTDPSVEIPPSEQMSLVARLRQPRTLLSIMVPIAILVIAIALNWKDMSQVPSEISKANLGLILVAFLIYYAGFPLRGERWRILLRGAGYKLGLRDSTEILFLSWLVNCIVPAKLGDLYRAWLLKMNSPVSATKTLGTVFIERILDLIAIAILGLAAGIFRFRDSLSSLSPVILGMFVFGFVIALLLVVALVGMRSFGRRIVTALPLPQRVVELYDRFEEGVFVSVGARGLPLLGILTVLIWATEAFRLYFVVRAFGYDEIQLGLSGALFVALIGSLLTAVPFTPAGLGLVELGVVGLLTGVFGATRGHAGAIILIDRTISVFSIVVLGAIAYVLSSKPRGGGVAVEDVVKASPA